MTIGREVELLALGLEKGTSMRDICPKCGGGSSKEKSLSITINDEGWLLWNCFRASCGLQGRRLAWGVVGQPTPHPKKLPKTFSGALETIRGEVGEWFIDNFHLNPGLLNELGWRFAPERDRLFIPYYGSRGQFRGSVLREWKNKKDLRNIVYKEILDEPFIGWMPETGAGPPVLVEDAISACKVYQAGLNAITLCGTHLSLHMVREILTKHKEAIIALDKDATAKAIKYAGTYRPLLCLKIWKLEKDLKYVEEERIREAYYGKKADFSSP
jgi:hypothetical protein